jgi:hypothetical protein
MPYYDGTGPYGTGPHGRGRGPCHAGEHLIGWGMGRGWCRGGYIAPVYPTVYLNEEPSTVNIRRKSIELEVEMLERRLKALKDQLSDMGSEPE